MVSVLVRLGTDRLYEMIDIARTVNDSMYFNRLLTENVENKVGFNNQHAVTIFPKF